MKDSKLAAIAMTRRTLAVTIFSETRLDYTQVRHLSSSHDKAEDSTVGFVRWIVATFGVDSAALETVTPGDTSRRAVLSRLVLGILREEGVPVWEVSKQQLFDAFAIPPLRGQRELREIIVSFWPVLNTRGRSPVSLDAAALGLYVETERLFST